MLSTILAARRRGLGVAAAGTGVAVAAAAAAWLLLQPAPLQPATPQADWDEAETWVFDPPPDPFGGDALLDLRGLNETVAGETGFVRVGTDGDFVRGDGQPLRFWGVNSDVGRSPWTARPLWPKEAPDLARHARFLAKRGVNLVRLHRQIAPDLDRDPKAALEDIDRLERDAIWRAVAAYRREGIYTVISPYWAVPMKFASAWGIAGGAEQSALGLLFFDERLQAAYKAWMRQLLAEPNPYTGLPLAHDPSVALVQLQNEDSLLFWTFNGIRGPQRRALELRFGRFIAERHGGSVFAALRAWGEASVDGDEPEAGRLALLDLWELTQPPPASAGRAARVAAQTEFLTRTMHDFNAEMTAYLKRELGVRPLVNAGNWRTASGPRLGDAERWSYLAADVDAVNRYTGGVHQGEHAGWAIVAGDRYTSLSVLREPGELPVALKQTIDRPILVTEAAWVPPNAYAAEGPLLVAAYSALSGVDGYLWFAADAEGFQPPGSANGWLPSQRKWIFATPETLGSFPAAALAYRRGDLRRGAAAVVEHRTLDALWARDLPSIAEEPGFDPNRDAGDAPQRSADRDEVPPEAFLAGPVVRGFGPHGEAGRAGPFDGRDGRGLIEPHRVRAGTGEIELNHVEGWVRVDAPRVQGVAAHFVQAAEHRLGDVSFRCGNAYGAALAVSMDGEPLARSRRILLQYATQSRPSGWRDRPAVLKVDGRARVVGREVVDHGGPPWRVVKARLEVEVRNPQLTTATVLDANGQPAGEVAVTTVDGGIRLSFPPDALYVLLR